MGRTKGREWEVRGTGLRKWDRRKVNEEEKKY